MESKSEKLHQEVLDEFEVDGKHAKIIRLRLEDINEADLSEHARNLADTNFRLIDSVPNAKERVAVRTQIFKAREKLSKFPFFGDQIRDSKVMDDLLNKVYPDYTHEEHFIAYRDRSFPGYIGKGHVLAVELDGRIVSVQAYKSYGDAPSGRSVYEFTKASTLNSPEYRGKGLNPRLKKSIFEEVMKENPDAIWVGASVNQDHLSKLESRGWHIVEMDDPQEAIKKMYETNPKYHDLMKEQGYKAMYFDPKVDHISWD